MEKEQKLYKIIWQKKALKQLSKLNLEKSFEKELIEETNKALEKNPYQNGKPLYFHLKGLWRYRHGDYRIIYEIIESKILVEVIEMDHRKDVYKKH